MTIFETSKIVGGEIIPSLAFEVKMGQVPDPSIEGNANWNPPYADINIQKIDIMIDAFKGGATRGPSKQTERFRQLGRLGLRGRDGRLVQGRTLLRTIRTRRPPGRRRSQRATRRSFFLPISSTTRSRASSPWNR